jgi:hypothetical protein
MKLLHSTKSSKIPNEIPIDAEAAITPAAFRQKFVKEKGVITDRGLVWTLPVKVGSEKGRHDGHTYEITVDPEWIQALFDALEIVKSGVLRQHIGTTEHGDEEADDDGEDDSD